MIAETNAINEALERQAIDQQPRLPEKGRTNKSGHRIDATEFTVTETEITAYVSANDRDHIGLPRSGPESQKQTE